MLSKVFRYRCLRAHLVSTWHGSGRPWDRPSPACTRRTLCRCWRLGLTPACGGWLPGEGPCSYCRSPGSSAVSQDQLSTSFLHSPYLPCRSLSSADSLPLTSSCRLPLSRPIVLGFVHGFLSGAVLKDGAGTLRFGRYHDNTFCPCHIAFGLCRPAQKARARVVVRVAGSLHRGHRDGNVRVGDAMRRTIPACFSWPESRKLQGFCQN